MSSTADDGIEVAAAEDDRRMPPPHMAFHTVGFVRWLLAIGLVLAVALAWAGYRGRELPFLEMRYQHTDSTGYRPLSRAPASLGNVPRTVGGRPFILPSPLPPPNATFAAVAALVNPTGPGAAVPEGRYLYEVNCVMCHGRAGHGDGAVGESYTPRPSDLGSNAVRSLSDGAIFDSISRGIVSTPIPEAARYIPRDWHAFSSETTDQQRWAMVDYVRFLEESHATAGR